MRALLIAAILLVLPAAALAQLAADLSSHLVTIRSDFSGEKLVLFGNLDAPLQEGETLVVTVRGPGESLLIRRKERIGGIWMNRQKVRFHDVPVYYRWYTSNPSAELSEAVRFRHQIGLDALGIRGDGDPDLVAPFKRVLMEARRTEKLYDNTPGYVTFITPTLFRTELTFPRQVPIGAYQVGVLLLEQDGAMPVALTTPLTVAKHGIGADVAWFATYSPLRYGLVTVLLAVLAGWGANMVFQRLPKKA